MYMRERFHDVLPPMPDAILFDVTQAAQWLMRDERQFREFSWKTLPPIVPPFENVWMEFHEPSTVLTDEGLVPNFFIHEQRACGIYAHEMPPDMQEYYAGATGELLQDAMERTLGRTLRMPEAVGAVDDDTSARWLVNFTVYQTRKDYIASVLNSVIALGHDGRCVGHIHVAQHENLRSLFVNRRLDTGELEWADVSDAVNFAAASLSQVFMFCLALLNCRNVEVIDKPAPPAPILKQRAKKGIPYIQYKTLEVTPLRTVSQGGQRKDGTPEPKALHFVRGHFKDFSDKGLFGKFKGVYWWSSQVRGDVAKGIIDKDYKVSHD